MRIDAGLSTAGAVVFSIEIDLITFVVVVWRSENMVCVRVYCRRSERDSSSAYFWMLPVRWKPISLKVRVYGD